MLFRRPRPPKLDKIDLTRVTLPDSDSESITSDSSSEAVNYNKAQSTNSSDREYVNSSIYYLTSHQKGLNRIKSAGKIEFPQLVRAKSFDTINESTGTPKTLPNSVLGVVPMPPELDKNEVDYSKIFEKHTYRNRMSPIRSAELYRKPRMESMATVNTSNNEIRFSRIKGYSYLPRRPIKYHHDDLSGIRKFNYDAFFTYDNTELYTDRNNENFKLNDFLVNQTDQNLVIENDTKKYLSSSNYKRIDKLLIKNDLNESKKIHIQTLVPELNPFENRKPTRQSLIEMASYLKEELKKKTGANLKTKFQSFSKWQRMNGAQTELVIFEEPKVEQIKEEPEITPSQIAILDCLLKESEALSLKSYFIDKLPDLKQLKYFIRYINLSFNNFREIPTELLAMRQLETIKIRCNPIRYITDELSNLQNLKVLVFSYCQLSEIPVCIFELGRLIHLDLAYNRIKVINEKIENLKTLKTLSLEGNEIEVLPCTMLKMTNLVQINVKNNYLHPLIWRNLLVNNAQSLFALSAVRFNQLYDEDTEQFYNLPEEIKIKLRNYETKCDCCMGKRYDDGLIVIRPHIKIFQVKYLPFLFYSCSPKCLKLFKTKQDI